MQTMQGGEMEAACHCGTVRFRVKLTDGFLHLFLLPDERSGGGVGRYRRHLFSGRRRSVDTL
jgi:hypothetical protein